MLKRHPLLLFFPLAFLLSWYPWVLFLIRKTGNGGPNPLGVLLAALIVTGIVHGRRGLKDFGSRLVRWRVGIQWYAVVLLLPAVLCIVAAAFNTALGATFSPAERLKNWPELIDRFLFIFLFIGLGEEPGWRGFALDELQKDRSALAASLPLACVWALWHLPLMGTEFSPAVIPAFLLSLFGGTLVQTWIYNNSRRSILLQMIFHSAVNTIGAGFIFPMFGGPELTRLWYIYAGLWVLCGAALVLTGRLQSSRREREAKLGTLGVVAG